jgi:hypothetical protein
MPARDLEQLAAQLGRPSTGLAAFAHLTPDEIALLSGAIERTRQGRRGAIEDAIGGAVPLVPRPLVMTLLRGRLPRARVPGGRHLRGRSR